MPRHLVSVDGVDGLGARVVQWNPSITATIGEQHDGRYTGVAVVEGFCV